MPAAREFDQHATADDVLEGIDLTGRHFVVTGATSGLGEESARALAAHGASVTMLARDEAKLADALARIGAVAQDPNYEAQDYDPWIAYGRSKTANAHFAYQLAKRFDGALSFSVHPGAIQTELMRHLPEETVAAARERVKDRAKTIPQGAATQIYAATAPEVEGLNGTYFANCAPGKPGEPTEYGGIKDYLYNDETASALWELSEHLVDETLA